MENKTPTNQNCPEVPSGLEFGFRQSERSQKFAQIPKVSGENLQNMVSQRIIEIKSDCLNAFGSGLTDNYLEKLKAVGVPQGKFILSHGLF